MSSNRPLSPHLQVYRPQLTSTLSITHRATGVFLSLGTAMLVYWLYALASGPQSFAEAQNCFGALPTRLLMLLWSWSLFYHLCNGIRHLFWDAGKGFEIETAYRNGYLVIAASVILTALSWIFAGGAS